MRGSRRCEKKQRECQEKVDAMISTSAEDSRFNAATARTIVSKKQLRREYLKSIAEWTSPLYVMSSPRAIDNYSCQL
ncbi:hypothetical protein SeLEV6574_g00861 [Synchytrium endobioticum]|uniref:Uncharacterized protein n=1 Tax=Synchytrium endobioticum TaxID=286115 RepID=A0A507DFW9_9FUNG|nr:hypothetical protein SeLEV6574_g00861 [Synchytrium endobioticum]